jgi:hypothetical protein
MKVKNHWLVTMFVASTDARSLLTLIEVGITHQTHDHAIDNKVCVCVSEFS